MKDRENITIAIKYELMYLQSNGAVANVVHRDLDLYFQGHNIFGNIIYHIWNMVKAIVENA